MNPLEIAAVVLGVVNVALVIVRSVWNFPVALAMVAIYAVVFHGVRLYSDMVLQGFFFALNIYGWRHWLAARGDAAVPVRWMSSRSTVIYALSAFAGWAIWSTAMVRLTDAAAPYWDGAVAALSVTAQIMLARRYVENWLYWIAVNLLAISLFWSRDLKLTSGLYALFLAMAVAGFLRWKRAADAA